MYRQWQDEGRLMGDFYRWLLEQVETRYVASMQRKKEQMDLNFNKTIR